MKGILVINMPTMCSNCILEQNGVINHKSYSYCGASGITTKHGYLLKDCPLKTLPQKKNKKDIVIKGRTAEILEARFEGWNDCLDEILGETE